MKRTRKTLKTAYLTLTFTMTLLKNNWQRILVILTSILVFFKDIGAYPLRNWDEAWYGEIIKNMTSSNYSYLMPFWNGRDFFDHAPLYFWLSLPITKFFGVGEWQIRLISAAAATITVFLIFEIAKTLKGIKLGLISVLVFLTLGQVIVRFKTGNLDSLLTALSLASFYFYLKTEQAIQKNGKDLKNSILCGISIGLLVLVKSWGLVVFPASIIFLYSLLKNKSLPKNTLIISLSTIAAFSWWYLWGIVTHGKQFISWYLLNPSEGRLETPLQNFSLFYIKTATRDSLFWLIPALASIPLGIKKMNEKWLIPFISIPAIFLFFLNFLSDKSDWYNIFAYPYLAILIAYQITKIGEKWQKVALVLVLGAALIQIYNVHRIENIYPDRSKVGADLGIRADSLIPHDAEVIFDDHDFTSFLFYSNQANVYTIEENINPILGEWWKIKKANLETFSTGKKNLWIVTPNPQDINMQAGNLQLKDYYNGYYFLKLE